MSTVIPFPRAPRRPEDLARRCTTALTHLLEVATCDGISGFAIAFRMRDGRTRALLAGSCEDDLADAVELTERMLSSF